MTNKQQSVAPCFAADGKTPVFSIPGYPLAVSAMSFNRQYVLLNEQQHTIEALNSCINGEDSTTTENLSLVDELQAEIAKLLAEEITVRQVYVAILGELLDWVYENTEWGCLPVRVAKAMAVHRALAGM